MKGGKYNEEEFSEKIKKGNSPRDLLTLFLERRYKRKTNNKRRRRM